MLEALQLLAVPAETPLNVTALVPCVAPKFPPVIVTGVPAGPEAGLREPMLGGGGTVTVNGPPLALRIATPPMVTTTEPVVAPEGTTTVMLVALQLVAVPAETPLNVTLLTFWDAPKFEPAMVTEVPTGPDVGFRLTIVGVNVKFTLLLAKPPTVTTTATVPAVPMFGAGTTILVALQLVGVVEVPLNVTLLVPCDAPKFVPVIVTEVPNGPEVGDKLVMLGGTPKATPLLAKPLTLTTTLPVVAPLGTGTIMLVALQLVGVAAAPLKVTAPVPCDAPKLFPLIVTEVPTGPEVGFKLVMVGLTVNKTRLLPIPLTITMTLPVVAPAGTGATMVVLLQLVGVAVFGPKVTLLVPCVTPKLVPVIVTEVPMGPDVGEMLVMLGATPKATPLLAKPLTVTTTLPVVAPFGTGAVMLVVLQLVGVAATPLKVTVLVPCEAPKFDPVMVTEAPKVAKVGLRLVILGGAITVKREPLLAKPPTVTVTLPVVAPLGTDTAMLVLPQLVGVAAVPLKVTVLVPWVAPKFAPAIVTVVPTGPEVGFRLVILGLATPPAGLKAAKRAPQLPEDASVAVAEAVPADA